jgi:23S rRNA (uracil1939-C5)-methyltransferase
MKDLDLIVTIDDLNSKGQGVAHHEGLAIFVDDALVGERVQVRLLEKKRSYARAKTLKIETSSTDRIEPRCPYFRSCGGCQLQHLNIKGQIRYKRERIRNAFKRIADTDKMAECQVEPSKNSFYYRNKLSLPVTMTKRGPALGFYKKASHEIVAISECHLHLKKIKPIFDGINELLGSSSISVYDEGTQRGVLRHVYIRMTEHKGQAVICFVVTKKDRELELIAKELQRRYPQVLGISYHVHKKPTNSLMFLSVKAICGQTYCMERLMGLDLKVSVGAFFQVNTLQAESIYNYILDHGEFLDTDVVVDAYCGIGTLTLLIASRVKKAIGIECYAKAIEDAKENQRLNRIENVEFRIGLAEKTIGSIDKIDALFINPPRKGCDLELLQTLRGLRVARLIYMSCDPSSLARDTKILMEIGYKPYKSRGFDMFSQTVHVETVVFFKRSLY